MKVLIISAETWRDDKNGGNVLSNIFNNTNFEFAQIYCNPGNPSNKLCKNYFQLTDTMIINSFFSKNNKIGNKIIFNDYPNDIGKKNNNVVIENKKFYNFFRKYNLEIFYCIKELLWCSSRWKNKELDNFIDDFDPDIIFAPCYGSHFMLALDRYVAKKTQKPVISYISDDHYTLKQFRFSPIYWINRIILRKNIRKTFKYYNLVYTMTEEQLTEYSSKLNCNMKILKKAGNFDYLNIKRNITFPIKMIYAGGLYCGRDKTLYKLAKVIKEINKDKQFFILDIYTGTQISNSKLKILNDGYNSRVNGLISLEDLKLKYQQSDIALHVESFNLKYKYLTRLSFSTKIIDCLESGCAVMAICWKKHAGYVYLKKNNIAICIDDVKDLKKILNEIISHKEIIEYYSKKAYEIGKRNHEKKFITNTIKKDFINLARENLNESCDY